MRQRPWSLLTWPQYTFDCDRVCVFQRQMQQSIVGCSVPAATGCLSSFSKNMDRCRYPTKKSISSWILHRRILYIHSVLCVYIYMYQCIYILSPPFYGKGTYPKCKLHFLRYFWRGPWKCKLRLLKVFWRPSPQKRHLEDVQRGYSTTPYNEMACRLQLSRVRMFA